MLNSRGKKKDEEEEGEAWNEIENGRMKKSIGFWNFIEINETKRWESQYHLKPLDIFLYNW